MGKPPSQTKIKRGMGSKASSLSSKKFIIKQPVSSTDPTSSSTITARPNLSKKQGRKMKEMNRAGSANLEIQNVTSTRNAEPSIGSHFIASNSTLGLLSKNKESSILPDISTKNTERNLKSFGKKPVKGKFVPGAKITVKNSHQSGIDNLLTKIDNNFVDEYIQNAFEPEKKAQKLTKAQKEKKRKKLRLRFITDKIAQQKKKRTFLTSCDVIAEPEPESPPPLDESSDNSEKERNNMLQELLDTQKVVRNGYDHLDNIRRMIKRTGDNVNHHMDTVEDLKGDLEFMDFKGQNFDRCLEKGNFQDMKFLKNNLKPSKKNSHSMRSLHNTKSQNPGIHIGENGELGQLMKNIRQKSHAKLGEDDKVQIVNTLLNINGSMKEFSQDLEFRLNKAYNNKAGKQFGLSKAQRMNYAKNKAFAKGDYDDVAANAQSFLNKFKKS
ncbi:unnamed protein product [Moneuplotes crassus]|uniref:Uncharacterized protein n=1 Tax=Euplotes crassus TaxID=5936 RepID=A0AAD1UGR7_EUPCR|nr:unnamed protein product [Moneuplotes crassus]